MSATHQGVENHRRAALADIVKGRTENLVNELKEGNAPAEDLAVYSGEAAPPTEGEGDPRRPADISPEAWNGMSDEEKGNALAAAKTPEPEAKQETEEEKAAREAQERKATEEAAAAAPKKIKGKVDGQDVEFDEQAVLEAGVRALQKESAADKRLEEATKARDEAERLRQSVEQTLAKLPQPEQTPKTQQEIVLAKDGLRDIVKKIQYGSEEEAADALVEYGNKMASLGQAEGLTQAELLNILDLREAQSFVKTNYADVVGDVNLKKLFVANVNEKLAAGDKRPYQEICKETGDELRQWKGAAPKPPTLAGGREAVRERKASVVVVPSASVRQAAPPQPKEPSPSEVIAKMRQARHQA